MIRRLLLSCREYKLIQRVAGVMLAEATHLVCSEATHIYHSAWQAARNLHPDDSYAHNVVVRIVAVATLYHTCELRRMEIVALPRHDSVESAHSIAPAMLTKMRALRDLCSSLIAPASPRGGKRVAAAGTPDGSRSPSGGSGEDAQMKLFICWLSVVDAEEHCLLGQSVFVVDANRAESGPLWEGDVHGATAPRSDRLSGSDDLRRRLSHSPPQPSDGDVREGARKGSTVTFAADDRQNDGNRRPQNAPKPNGSIMNKTHERASGAVAAERASREAGTPRAEGALASSSGLTSPRAVSTREVLPASTAQSAGTLAATDRAIALQRYRESKLRQHMQGSAATPQRSPTPSDSGGASPSIQRLALDTSTATAALENAFAGAQRQLEYLSELCSSLSRERKDAKEVEELLSSLIGTVDRLEGRLKAVEGRHGNTQTDDVAIQCEILGRGGKSVAVQTETVVFAEDVEDMTWAHAARRMSAAPSQPVRAPSPAPAVAVQPSASHYQTPRLVAVGRATKGALVDTHAVSLNRTAAGSSGAGSGVSPVTVPLVVGVRGKSFAAHPNAAQSNGTHPYAGSASQGTPKWYDGISIDAAGGSRFSPLLFTGAEPQPTQPAAAQPVSQLQTAVQHTTEPAATPWRNVTSWVDEDAARHLNGGSSPNPVQPGDAPRVFVNPEASTTRYWQAEEQSRRAPLHPSSDGFSLRDVPNTELFASPLSKLNTARSFTSK